MCELGAGAQVWRRKGARGGVETGWGGTEQACGSGTQHVFQKYEPPLTHRPHNNLNPAPCPAPSGPCRQRVNKADKVLPRGSRSCRVTETEERKSRTHTCGQSGLTRSKQAGTGDGGSGFQIGWPGGASLEVDSSSHGSEVRVQLTPGEVTRGAGGSWTVPGPFATINTTGVGTVVSGAPEASAATVYTTEWSRERVGSENAASCWFVGQTHSWRCVGTPLEPPRWEAACV